MVNINLKEKKIVDVNVKFPDDKIKISSCVFPDFYNDTFLINCTINNIKDVNTSKGFEYGSGIKSFNLKISQIIAEPRDTNFNNS